MRYLTLLALTLATPALASFSLRDIQEIQSDAVPGCKDAYEATIPSCSKLPGSCSKKCLADLKTAAGNVILACRMTNDPQGLLKSVFSGTFVREMCSDSQNINSDSTLVFATGVQSALASPTLAIDPSFPVAEPTDDVLATATAPSPTAKYAPSTMQTSSSAAATGGSTSSTSSNSQPADANGSPFGSTENQKSAGSKSNFIIEKSGAVLLLSMVIAALI